MPDRIVGIDLGTTNSLVAFVDAHGSPRVIPDAQGHALLPSVVRFNADGTRTVGREAKAHAAEFPRTTLSSVKRLMGRSRADAAPDLAYLSYDVVDGDHGQCRISIPGATLVTPQEVSAIVLRALREQASRALGEPISRAVITVPAYFDHAQREATKDAGRLAGLDVVRIVPEPTAAALAYGLGVRATGQAGGLKGRAARHVAVFDLGGGTFDISILRVIPPESDTGREIFQVLATAGDTHLGGDDVDHLLVERFTREIDPRHSLTPHARQALLAAAERAKIALSEAGSTTIEVPIDESFTFRRELTREELEALMEPWLARAIECCRRAMHDAHDALAGSAVDAVVMVGGCTRIPLVRRRVGEFFSLEPYTAIDPDQVVALGAAVQASILAGNTSDALLLDVIPLSLGLETAHGAVAKLILRNSAVPARATEMFSTQVDGQTSIKLHVVQGEREMVSDCRSLGVFHLRGLPPMPAGIPQVEVEFLVDANAVLRVNAHERRSGRRFSAQLVPNHGLTREEVERMERESLANARDDMARHRIADLIANSTLDLKWIGERLAHHAARLDPAYASELQDRIARLREMVESARLDWKRVDPDAFYRAKNELDRASVRLQEVSIAESLREE